MESGTEMGKNVAYSVSIDMLISGLIIGNGSEGFWHRREIDCNGQ